MCTCGRCLQIVNHGTDHRAQLLSCLHDVGIKTVSQDYIFYAYDVPWLPNDGTSCVSALCHAHQIHAAAWCLWCDIHAVCDLGRMDEMWP